MTCQHWPLCDPEALADTFDMGAMLAAYITKYQQRGFMEARAVAVGLARDAGWELLPSSDGH